MTPAGACPLVYSSSQLDLGTIFRDAGERFLESEHLTADQRRVFRRIAECRTAAMGGALYRCSSCGHPFAVYHSCRDRHCPQCQSLHRAQWLHRRLEDWPPVPAFHIVFTLPHKLNALIAKNPKPCLSLLFRSTSQTLRSFASDPKYLGAEPAIITVLHTWGQKLNLHYHLHCIVSAGGLNPQRTQWICPPHSKFLFPVHALGQVFRGKYLSGLDAIRHELADPPHDALQSDHDWQTFKRALAYKPWNVYAKRPYGRTVGLMRYLAQYANRVAISNKRLVAYDGRQVRFRYKQYRKQTCQPNTLTLDADAFIRRFLRHVLPKGFVRIRYYGLLAHCKKRQCLQAVRRILTLRAMMDVDPQSVSDAAPFDSSQTAIRCPSCGSTNVIHTNDVPIIARRKARSLLWDTS